MVAFVNVSRSMAQRENLQTATLKTFLNAGAKSYYKITKEKVSNSNNEFKAALYEVLKSGGFYFVNRHACAVVALTSHER